MQPLFLPVENHTFQIRRLEPNDAPSLAQHANNPNIANVLRDRFPNPYTEQDAINFIKHTQETDKESIFAIVSDQQAVGSIGLMFQDDIYRFSAEIGYWLGESYWGKGIISTAIPIITRHAFKDLKFNRVFAKVSAKNTASMRVLEKTGFQLEGIGRKASFKNGEWIDEYNYALLRK